MADDRLTRLIAVIFICLAWGVYRHYDPRIMLYAGVIATALIVAAAVFDGD